MKICIATDAWHPQINGVVTTLSRTTSILRQKGHELLLITPEQFRTVPCPSYREIRLSLVSAAAIRRRLVDFSPHAVHIATEGPIGWTTRTVCQRERFPFTTSYHTRFPEYLRMRAPIPLALTYWLVKRFHGAAERTMVAPTLLEELAAKGFPRLVAWNRGVDTRLFRPQDRRPGPSPRPLFVFVGRVATEKNLPAFLDLPLPGSKMVIGDGPDLPHLRKHYPAVLFTGAKKGEDLALHLAAADVFIFPSVTDTFGIVLLEAMACGVPVAAYPVTGPKFLVKNGINGHTDENLFTAAMRALEVPRESCRASVSSFCWEDCADQFLGNLAVNAERSFSASPRSTPLPRKINRLRFRRFPEAREHRCTGERGRPSS